MDSIMGSYANPMYQMGLQGHTHQQQAKIDIEPSANRQYILPMQHPLPTTKVIYYPHQMHMMHNVQTEMQQTISQNHIPQVQVILNQPKQDEYYLNQPIVHLKHDKEDQNYYLNQMSEDIPPIIQPQLPVSLPAVVSQTVITEENTKNDFIEEEKEQKASIKPIDDDPLTIMIYNFIKSENEAKAKIEAEKEAASDEISSNESDHSTSPVVAKKVRKLRKVKTDHVCNVCQKTFNRCAALTQHLRIHSGEKPLKCEFCEKQFNTSSSLSRHRKIHTDTRIHMCEVCSKKFSTPVDLKKHLRIHTGEKPYKCEICAKAFAQFGNLNMHLRSHTGERPHSCDLCPKRFSSPYKMQLHRRIHTGEKNYKCDICLKAFTQNTHLVQHRKTHIAKEFRNYNKYHNM